MQVLCLHLSENDLRVLKNKKTLFDSSTLKKKDDMSHRAQLNIGLFLDNRPFKTLKLCLTFKNVFMSKFKQRQSPVRQLVGGLLFDLHGSCTASSCWQSLRHFETFIVTLSPELCGTGHDFPQTWRLQVCV